MKSPSASLIAYAIWAVVNVIGTETLSGKHTSFTHDDVPIPVFTLDGNGYLVPVVLDFTKIADVKFPSQDVQTSWPADKHQYVNTSRGLQHVHTCSGPTLVARGREHHLKLHRRQYNTENQTSGEEREFHRYRRQTDNQASQRSHVVETIMFGDYALYSRFYAMNNNPTRTLLAMYLYYANIFRGVNRRYESATQPPFSITTLLTTLVILTERENYPWTENNRVGRRVRGEAALQAFTTFAAEAKESTPIFYDHATLVTGYDLYSNDGRNNLLGLAYTFGMCSRDSSSLVEESFSEQTANTLAHEIGHSLGSAHDGEGNACSAASYYIMAATSALPTSLALARNPWTFSPCSVSLMRTFLNRGAGECTLTVQTTDPVDFSRFLVQEWGQVQNADFQCRQRFGASSRFCREDYFRSNAFTFEDMCYNLRCFNPRINSCTVIPAHDGTSCANQKWCQQGLCLFNLMAPTRFVNCPQRDDPTRGCTPSNCQDELFNPLVYCCGTCYQDMVPRPFSSPSPVFDDLLPVANPENPAFAQDNNQLSIIDFLFSLD